MNKIYYAGCILLLLFLMYPASAQENPYQKIAVVNFAFDNGTMNVVSAEIQYGTPPNLNIQSGSIEGLLLDAQHRTLNTFSIRDPSTQVGEAVATATSGQAMSGYTVQVQNGQFGVIIPYTPDLRYLDLVDSGSGRPLATMDLSPAIAAFQQTYPSDPDMQALGNMNAANTFPITEILLISGIFITCIAVLAYFFLFLRHRVTRILIVDDEEAIVDVFSQLLKKKGYLPIPAHSGEECLSILKVWWKRPDLILLDVMMNPMNGWETLEEIKKNPSLKKIPVLMLTGIAPTMQQTKRYGLCIDDYILKPVNAMELYGAIEYVQRRRELIRQDIRAATKAGFDKEMVCEYARLRKRVEVEKKLLGMLRPVHSTMGSVQDDLTSDMGVMNTEIKLREEILNQLQRKLASVLSSP